MDTVHECDRRIDGQTDRQTDRITITKTVQRIASHGKNAVSFSEYGIKSQEKVGPTHIFLESFPSLQSYVALAEGSFQSIKKLSYCLETVRCERLSVAETLDVEMTA